MIWMYVALGGVGLILLIIGSILIFFRKRKKERCEYKSTAVICDAKGYHGGDLQKTYHAVYEYEYGGKKYYKESPVGISKMPKIGKEVDVYINPNKPKEYYIKSFGITFSYWLLVVLGVIFIILTIVLYFLIGV